MTKSLLNYHHTSLRLHWLQELRVLSMQLLCIGCGVILQEAALCRQLLTLVNHHHNKLSIVRLVPCLSERSVDLRMTLAYFAICQLISVDFDLSEAAPISWSMNSLAHKYFSLEINDSMDMYLLLTLISLFDIAVGSAVDLAEKVRVI